MYAAKGVFVVALMIMAVSPGSSAEPRKREARGAEELLIRQAVSLAKKLPAKAWNGVSASSIIDEHDFVVELRVSEGDEKVRESLMLFISLVAEHGEREKEVQALLFGNGDCGKPPLPYYCTLHTPRTDPAIIETVQAR